MDLFSYSKLSELAHPSKPKLLNQTKTDSLWQKLKIAHAQKLKNLSSKYHKIKAANTETEKHI